MCPFCGYLGRTLLYCFVAFYFFFFFWHVFCFCFFVFRGVFNVKYPLFNFGLYWKESLSIFCCVLLLFLGRFVLFFWFFLLFWWTSGTMIAFILFYFILFSWFLWFGLFLICNSHEMMKWFRTVNKCKAVWD